MTDPVFPRIAIIGAGLIGSSIARAAREYGAAGEIALYDAAEDVRARAAGLGLGEVSPTLEAAVAGADCVLLCVPVGALGAAAATA
ncbi:MAG TPA: prephenate dehydrogenase/arogenate dehydrogenase family protein, partial [Hyphomonas sp.]|nr:prephenate dehydrogenase/arogenate dehydrogenase family protein [Hyphomonas sp.]